METSYRNNPECHIELVLVPGKIRYFETSNKFKTTKQRLFRSLA